MAKSRQKEQIKKHEKSKNKGRMLDISALAVVDNIVFNKTNAWGFYRIEANAYESIDVRGRIADGLQTSMSLSDLMGDRDEPLEVHLFNSVSPLDIEAWRFQMEETIHWGKSQELYDYIDKTSDYLYSRDFSTKSAYIGVDLGNRGSLDLTNLNPFEAGVKEAMKTLGEWFDSIFSQYGEDVSKNEEAKYRKKEEQMYGILNKSGFKAERVTAEEILLLIKRQFYPAMETPYLNVSYGERFSAGDLVYELDSVIEHNYRWLKFEQLQTDPQTGEIVEMEGYRATLSLSSFPREWTHAIEKHPFLYTPDRLTHIPHNTFARLTLLPREKMQKDIEGKKKEMKDELKSFRGGMTEDTGIVNSNEDLASAISDLREMDKEITGNRSAWVKGSYHIVVEAPDVKSLKERIESIRQALSPDDIVVLHTSGDQMDLFLEQMPGDRKRIKSFDQTTNLNFVSAAGINIAERAGDETAVSGAITYKDRLSLEKRVQENRRRESR